jgi:predicted ATPase
LEISKSLTVKKVSAYHRAIHLSDSVTGIDANLIDCGYGAAQVIPVLLGLASHNTGLLVLEQPEVHLHPRAQGKVGEFIVDASARRQILVETHSEHLINRARIAIAEKRIPHDSVQILYVERSEVGSRVLPIGINRSGDFLEKWPNGFFDERFEDTMRLSDLRE